MVHPQPGPAGLVTPEAVVLDFETAGLGSRLVAAVIDSTVQGVGFLGLILVFGLVAGTGGSGWLAGVGLFVGVFLLLFGYPIGFETLWRGRTPGKAAMGLRVVTVEGAPVRFRHAVIRGALALVDIYMSSGFVGACSIIASRRNQRLGDLVAGTVVLRERRATRAPSAIAFQIPAGYEPYAATVDPSGIGGPDYEAVRTFLVRAATLPPDVRATLAAQLATPLAARIRHTPPPGITAEAFLVCLAARWQHRAGAGVPLIAPPPAPIPPPPAPTAAAPRARTGAPPPPPPPPAATRSTPDPTGDGSAWAPP